MIRALPFALAVLVAAPTYAQEAPAEPAPAEEEAPDPTVNSEPTTDVEPTTDGEPDLEPEAEPDPVPEPEVPVDRELRPKVALVLVGDPDARLRGLAVRVDRALEGVVDRPVDAALRRALIGTPTTNEDGLNGVRRERRRLGLGEARDIPVLTALARRAGAVSIAVVRGGTAGPELVVFDVRNGAFFEGSLALTDDSFPSGVADFVHSRARASARATLVSPELPSASEPSIDLTGDDTDEEDEPDLFEQAWPYIVAGALLAAMITIIAVAASTDGSDTPVLRFVPGGN